MTMRNLIEISPSEGYTFEIQLPDEFDDKSSAGAVLTYPSPGTRLAPPLPQVKFPLNAREAFMVMGVADGSAFFVVLGEQPGSDDSLRLAVQRFSGHVSLNFYKKSEQPKEEERVLMPEDILSRAMKHVIRTCAIAAARQKEMTQRSAALRWGTPMPGRGRSYPPDSYYPPDRSDSNKPVHARSWPPPSPGPGDWHTLAESGD